LESPTLNTLYEADVSKYKQKTPLSFKMYAKARELMPGGQSHNARFFDPYPFFAAKAKGKYLWDIDGNRYVDYWMGHTALILGHSPEVVAKEIRNQAVRGLLFGSPNKYALELAELVNEIVPCAEMIRFCTTGTEATMYAVRLARAFTGRNTVVKMAGGWHGYNSSLSVGVNAPYDVPESAGLVGDDDRFVKLARFNDLESTRLILEESSQDVAAVILEPVMGAGGVLPAEKQYLEFLKKKCDEIGALLIFDEIITGFRLGLGGAQEHYGIKPDLCTLGKNLGGGLPVSAIAGRSEIMELADVSNKSKTQRAWIGGGTFSENALCLRAGIATLRYLQGNHRTVYKKINAMGDQTRREVDRIFSENGVRTKTTGVGSLFATHFLAEDQKDIRSPADVNASEKKAGTHYYFSLIVRDGIYYLPGHVGAISTAHRKTDIDQFLAATERYAKKFSNSKK